MPMLDISTDALTGLSDAEVATRRAQGEVNTVDLDNGRSYWHIIRTNLFSFFNNILYTLGILLIMLGQTSDAILSVGLAIFNITVNTIQEIRAKRQLEKVALLSRPEVTVMRNGRSQTLSPSELVKGDIIMLQPGDQATVDGRIVDSGIVEVDESLLTGETDLIRKQKGDNILSGSYCVTGECRYLAEKVGMESYANQLTASARAFKVTYTPMERNVNFIVRLIMFIVAIIASFIFTAALLENLPFNRLVEIATVLTGLVPYGLFSMIAVAYAMGASKIAKQGALVQRNNAVESLSNVDVLCMDKTGTLTANRLQFDDLYRMADQATPDQIGHWLGTFVHSATSQNKTSEALAKQFSGEKRPFLDEVPFASVRKWSALAFPDGVYALGALEMLRPHLAADFPATALAQAAAWESSGLRVLLFASAPPANTLHDATSKATLPPLTPLALIALRDELRPFAAQTLAAFTDLGIALKIISGDSPHTVAALAKQAGWKETAVISGSQLEGLSTQELQAVTNETTIFGRISPEQKQMLIESLVAQGHYVAMMGDGVNDVLSLKKAQLGIAMQSGSQITRNIADMVLLDDSFAALQPAFQQGKNIVGGLTRAMYLFLVRVIASALIIVAIAIMGLSFPFEPSQVALTIFTVGLPAFFLTLWARPLFLPEQVLRSLIRFSVPASLVTVIFAVGIYTAMTYAVLNQISQFQIPPGVVRQFEIYTGLVYNVDEAFGEAAATIVAQTFMSAFISYSAFLLLLFLEPPHRWFEGWTKRSEFTWTLWLALGLWLVFTIVIMWEPSSSYFGLVPLQPPLLLGIWLLVLVWALLLRFLWRHNWLDKTLGF